jgi:hypothetical protein
LRHIAALPLVAASLLGLLSLPECTNAQTNPYALDRLFLDVSNSLPLNEVLSFNSAAAVENFFGVSSPEATLANDFFSGYNGSSATMLFDRFVPGGGRARLFGGDISGLTLPQLQAINGALSLTSEGYNFNASVNLSSATSFKSAASLIQSAFAAARPTVAITAGSSIAPGSASFTGSIAGGVMDVTAVSTGSIAIGGIVTSANGYAGHIVDQTSGAPGGAGEYNVWYAPSGPNSVIAPSGATLSETYGTLTIGAAASGAVAIGQEVTGSGVKGNTAIEANISGSGSGSKWIVDLTQTVASGALTMKAAPLDVTYQAVTGATVNSGALWIEQNGDYTVMPSSMTYVSGTAAALLRLTQAAGAYDSTPGQSTTSLSAWMNNIVQNETNEFASFQTTYNPRAATPPSARAALEAWAQSSDGSYSYLEAWSANTPPIEDSLSPNAQQLFAARGAAVPEPPSSAMILLGFAGLGFAGYRSARKGRAPLAC